MIVAELFWSVWRLRESPDRWVKFGDYHIVSLKTNRGHLEIHVAKTDQHHMTVGALMNLLERKTPKLPVCLVVERKRHQITKVVVQRHGFSNIVGLEIDECDGSKTELDGGRQPKGRVV